MKIQKPLNILKNNKEPIIFLIIIGISITLDIYLGHVIGIIAFIFLLVLWRIIIGWEHIMFSIRYIETLLWTKPLDKDFWDKGEFNKFRKGRKIKFVWKKKDDKTKKERQDKLA